MQIIKHYHITTITTWKFHCKFLKFPQIVWVENFMRRTTHTCHRFQDDRKLHLSNHDWGRGGSGLGRRMNATMVDDAERIDEGSDGDNGSGRSDQLDPNCHSPLSASCHFHPHSHQTISKMSSPEPLENSQFHTRDHHLRDSRAWGAKCKSGTSSLAFYTHGSKIMVGCAA